MKIRGHAPSQNPEPLPLPSLTTIAGRNVELQNFHQSRAIGRNMRPIREMEKDWIKKIRTKQTKKEVQSPRRMTTFGGGRDGGGGIQGSERGRLGIEAVKLRVIVKVGTLLLVVTVQVYLPGCGCRLQRASSRPRCRCGCRGNIPCSC